MRKAWCAAVALWARCSAPAGKVKVSECHWKTGNRSGRAPRTGSARPASVKATSHPAEFGCSPEVVVCPIGAGEDLGAKADAEHGLVGLGIGGHQVSEARQVGVDVIISRRLFAAEDDQRIGIGRVRQGLAGPGAVKVDQGGAFMQGHADQPVMGDAGILDNGDAHGALRESARGVMLHEARLQAAGPVLLLRPGAAREKGNRQTTLAPGGNSHGDSRGPHL